MAMLHRRGNYASNVRQNKCWACMTTEAKSNSKWKRALRLVLNIYAGLCTLLVTAYLAVVLWSIFILQPSPVISETNFMASYGAYVANESPNRAEHFWRLATALGMYSERGFRAISRRAQVSGQAGPNHGHSGDGFARLSLRTSQSHEQMAVFAFLKDGKLTEVGFNDASAIDRLAYQPYPAR
jgi:hypothetical protein